MGSLKKPIYKEKHFFAFLAIIFLVLIAALFVTGYERGLIRRYGKICTTKDCVNAASLVIRQMNTSVDPCEDFFEYACGQWVEDNPIPADKQSFSVSSLLDKSIDKHLRNILQKPIFPNDKEQDKKAKAFYQSCMNTDAMDKEAATPVLSFITKLGGWPMLSKLDDTATFDLEASVARINNYGYSALWNEYVSADDKNSKVNIISFGQASLGLPRSYFLKERYADKLTAYAQFAKDYAIAIGGSEVKVNTQVDEMIAFEVELAKVTQSRKEMRADKHRYNKVNVTRLVELFNGEVDMLRYLNLKFELIGYKVEASQEIVVYGLQYFPKLSELLKKTDKRTLANYIIWRCVRRTIKYLSPSQFGGILSRYYKVMSGTSSAPPRWSTCVRSTTSAYMMGIGRLFVDKYFGIDALNKATDMISRLKEAFGQMMLKTDWMDDNTKGLAIHKIKAMHAKIGYPQFILNDTYMKIEYEGMTPIKDEYLTNVGQMWKFKTTRDIGEITKPVNKMAWYMGPSEVNAYYSPNNNVIAFPAGIIQPPFYDKTWPMSLNYGGFGGVVGHEITHGFDDEGSQFDADGNMVDWWPKDVVNAFKKKTDCVVRKFNNYIVKSVKLHINGVTTLGENIADIGGLRESFNAYRNWVKEQGEEEHLLPGIGVDHNQLFFIGYAQTWCGTRRDASMIHKINSNPHSPTKYRVLGPVSDLQEFSEAFKCKKGQPMNPATKCNVW